MNMQRIYDLFRDLAAGIADGEAGTAFSGQS